MGGVKQNGTNGKIITINNLGIINAMDSKSHFNTHLTLQNYAMVIKESATNFNAFNSTTQADNSHLIVEGNRNIKFKDKDSKLILDFGGNFEFGKGYLFSKLVVDTSGNNALSVDLSHLTTRTSLYKLTQNGDNFIVSIDAPNSEIGILHKSNVRTMNNFYVMSNAMIYPHKFAKKQVVKKKRVIRRVKKTASAFRHSEPLGEESTTLNQGLDLFALDSSLISSLKNDKEGVHFAYNDRFFYKNDSTTYTNQNNINHIRIANANERANRNKTTTNRTPSSQTIPNALSNQNKYYFILTPFTNHNLFFESGRYNLSGLEYGFLTAFSGKLNSNNSLGTHFIMSYGSLNDSKDKDFMIKSLNLNVGLNYKLDLIFDMYLKARGDFYYFLNQAKTLTMFEAIKPNNMGFGLSVSYGKEWDFKSGGVLGIEVGLDYKALQSSTISLQNNADRSVSETYQKALYHLIYVDVGLNYNKYFNSSVGLWGINATLGIKGNITANKLAKSQIHINNLNRSVDMVLDNDKILGYANLGASYVLNAKSFDMEFSLAYFGNYGDRIISNAGGFEWRVVW